MAWLWIISVGVTDIQFPVWSKDEYGMWTVLRRFDPGRAGIRAVHEGLLALLRNDQIRFEGDLPKPIGPGVARDLRLEFIQDGADFLMTIRHKDYRISGQADAIPNTCEVQLPLYCPKVEELLPLARETFTDGPLTVLVLNTQRADGFSEASDEPIASGPLVAKCLAERLGLTWVDGQGQMPESLTPGTSTWIDILTNNEAVEDPTAQQNVVTRLSAAIQAWTPGSTASSRAVITTSGGLPPLKPLIERVPAICFGQANAQLLDKPQREAAQIIALNYDSRVTEREILRFHCAEALRAGDYTGAYGLASRTFGQPWASAVRDGLGSLLEFPGPPLQLNGRDLALTALTACRIEIRLCLGDVIGALIRLGTFIESSIWDLIAQDSRIRNLGLQVDRDDECLVGKLAQDHLLFKKKMLEEKAKGKNHHRMLGLTWLWIDWLCQNAQRAEIAKALNKFRKQYEKKPRVFRNRLIHGTDIPIDPQVVEQHMKAAALIVDMGRPFGQNFLSVPDVDRLLTGLGHADLATAVSEHLKVVLNRVLKG